MSNLTNDIVRERAFEARERAVGTVWEKELDAAIQADDLDLMRKLSITVENYLRVWESEYNDAN